MLSLQNTISAKLFLLLFFLFVTFYIDAQNVGIGTDNPTRPLSFPPFVGKKISLYPGALGDAGFGVFGNELRIHSDYAGADITLGYDDYALGFTERMRIKGNGNVGIGTPFPGFPLSFAPIVGDKISLWSNSANSYGFGIQGALLQIHSSDVTADIAFGYGSSEVFGETVRMKGNGNVGIGTSTPLSRLHVVDSSVLFSAVSNAPASPGLPPIQGPGRRMMWYADKAAFRAGIVSGPEWDKDSIGLYSFASGFGTIAKGNASTAMGIGTKALGLYSTAMGILAIASGQTSLAIGDEAKASGDFSTAIGPGTTASGYSAIAIGNSATASGNNSITLGSLTTANGNGSMALGYITIASGLYSTAMGRHVSTNGHSGSFVIGDASTSSYRNASAANQMMMVFSNGYHLYTNSGATIGLQVSGGGNAWSTISDVHRKENFLHTDGEAVLSNISRFSIGSWNYKGQDAKQFRHYGPIAQEFFTAFGHDDYGIIGNDTTINQADFDGINLIAIQALEKRTQQLPAVVDDLVSIKSVLQKKDDELAQLRKEMDELKKQVEQLMKNKK